MGVYWVSRNIALTLSISHRCIMGFVTKDRTKALLYDKAPGTFLLRFSESNRDGAITFSWVQHDANGETHLHSDMLWNNKELKVQRKYFSLAFISKHQNLDVGFA